MGLRWIVTGLVCSLHAVCQCRINPFWNPFWKQWGQPTFFEMFHMFYRGCRHRVTLSLVVLSRWSTTRRSNGEALCALGCPQPMGRQHQHLLLRFGVVSDLFSCVCVCVCACVCVCVCVLGVCVRACVFACMFAHVRQVGVHYSDLYVWDLHPHHEVSPPLFSTRTKKHTLFTI